MEGGPLQGFQGGVFYLYRIFYRMKINRKIQFHNEWFLLLSPAFLIIRGFARFPEAIHWSDIVFLFFGIWLLVSVDYSDAEFFFVI